MITGKIVSHALQAIIQNSSVPGYLQMSFRVSCDRVPMRRGALTMLEVVLTVICAVIFVPLTAGQLFSHDAHLHLNPLFIRPPRSTAMESSAVGPKCTSSYGDGICGAASTCGAWFDVVTSDSEFSCRLSDGRGGYCCPKANPNLLWNRAQIFEEPEVKTKKIEKFGYDEVKWADSEAHKYMEELDIKEHKWMEEGFYKINDGSPATFHSRFFTAHAGTNEDGRKAFAAILAAEKLAKKHELSPDEAGWSLRQFSVIDTKSTDNCRENVTCDKHALYRTFDGSCNNLEHPYWGKANTPFTRLQPPAYEDGIWTPKMTAVSGDKLPSARKVSGGLEPEKDIPLNGVTLLVQAYGQFLDHDLILGALFSGPNNTRIPCCTPEGKHIESADHIHPACFPIDIPKDDPFFSQFGAVCMDFVRALPSPNLDCSYGYALQMNQASQVIDASMVYGTSEDEVRKLRDSGGKMKVTDIPGLPEPLLPQHRAPDDACADHERGLFCFVAGDSRVNEQVALTILHTIFVREHNRLVDVLVGINPHWDDEKLFQEARRIVAAEIQHITYNEWLPLVIGSRTMYEHGITPLTDGYSGDYDETVNPSAASEFNIAFRFGHTLLQGHYELMNERYNVEGEIKLRSVFNNPLSLYRTGAVERILRGLLTQKIQAFDNKFTEDVQHHLFAKDTPFGLDLVALNVQRSRDHAIRSYNDYRAFCHKDRARNFADLLDSMDDERVEALRRTYEHVDDIDFFIGGVFERPVPGAIVGPTFSCVISEHFAKAKKGDRFFYDVGGQRHSFNPYQLREIRKVTLARIICNNVKGMKRLQPMVFYEASNVNNIVPCDSYLIPELDLFAGWKELP